jgi:hypothetical protein
MNLRFTILLVFLVNTLAFSQVIIAQQDFETAPEVPTVGFTATSGNLQSGQLPATGYPANGNLFNNGLQSFGVNNQTANVDFLPINTLFYKNISLNVKCASYSTTTTSNGADATDLIEVFISTDGVNYLKEIELKGSTNARWTFNATGNAVATYFGNGTFLSFAPPITGTNPAGYSTITINNLPSVSNLYIRIGLKNNAAGELWLIDDFKVEGVVNLDPTIISNKNSIVNINYVVGNGPSVAQTYTLNAINLTPSSGDITLQAPTNFEISTDANVGFVDNIVLGYNSNALAATPIFARLKTDLAIGNYGGVGFNVSHTGGGALIKNVKLSGEVSDGLVCGALTNIAVINATIPAQNTFSTTMTYTIRGKVTGVFGVNKFYLQDSTGGIAVYKTNVVSGNSIQLGDFVTLNGTPVRFNGEAEFEVGTCIQKLGGGSVPMPIVYDVNTVPTSLSLNAFLAANEGSLVKIVGSNVLNYGTFSANTNYNISTCNNKGFLEIRLDAGATSIIGTTIPNVTQEITGVVGRFINLAGTTDKFQIFPRILPDFTNAAITCLPDGGCGLTNFTQSDSTFDVFNWNLEWIGNPTLGPVQSGVGDATQIQNCKTVINNVNADLYMLQEICDYNNANPLDTLTVFGKLVKSLNTTYGANTYSGECSSSYSYSYIPTPDPYGQRVCVIYKNAVVSKIFARPMFENLVLDFYPPTGLNTQFWASGRKPFQFMAEINLNSKKDTVLFIGLHAKSGSAPEDYERRKFDVKVMYDSLQMQYPNKKTMIFGDMNDDMDRSIYVGGGSHASTFAPFLHANPADTLFNSIKPNPKWNPISKVFSLSGCASTTSFSDYIDHQIVSIGFTNYDTGLKYVNNSIASYRPVIANYSLTTSDHYATISRFNFYNRPLLMPCVGQINLSSPTNDFSNTIGDVTADRNFGKINVTNKIINSSNINYIAPVIELKPGFLAENGVVFKTIIGGCN